MTHYVLLDANECVEIHWDTDGGSPHASALKVVTTLPAGPGEVGWSGPVAIDAAAVKTMMRSGNLLADRPQSPAPVLTGSQVDITGMDAGTTVEVFDLGGDELLTRITAPSGSYDEALTFSDAGHYLVEVQGPVPQLSSTLEFMI